MVPMISSSCRITKRLKSLLTVFPIPRRGRLMWPMAGRVPNTVSVQPIRNATLEPVGLFRQRQPLLLVLLLLLLLLLRRQELLRLRLQPLRLPHRQSQLRQRFRQHARPTQTATDLPITAVPITSVCFYTGKRTFFLCVVNPLSERL